MMKTVKRETFPAEKGSLLVFTIPGTDERLEVRTADHASGKKIKELVREWASARGARLEP